MDYNLSCETLAYYATKEEALEDRKLFVKNLGILLSQTREGIDRCELSDNDIVTVYYRSGISIEVNVHMDSYAAIIKDVMKQAL